MTRDPREWELQILKNKKSKQQEALCEEMQRHRGNKYFSKKRPFKPNHSEVFGLMRDYGPAQGVGVAEADFDLEDESD